MVMKRQIKSIRPIGGMGEDTDVLTGWGLGSGGVLEERGFLEARYSQSALASPMTSAVLHSAEIGGSSSLWVRNSLFVDLLLIRLSLIKIHGDGGDSLRGGVRERGGDFLFLFGGGRQIVSIGCTTSMGGALASIG